MAEFKYTEAKINKAIENVKKNWFTKISDIEKYRNTLFSIVKKIGEEDYYQLIAGYNQLLAAIDYDLFFVKIENIIYNIGELLYNLGYKSAEFFIQQRDIISNQSIELENNPKGFEGRYYIDRLEDLISDFKNENNSKDVHRYLRDIEYYYVVDGNINFLSQYEEDFLKKYIEKKKKCKEELNKIINETIDYFIFRANQFHQVINNSNLENIIKDFYEEDKDPHQNYQEFKKSISNIIYLISNVCDDFGISNDLSSVLDLLTEEVNQRQKEWEYQPTKEELEEQLRKAVDQEDDDTYIEYLEKELEKLKVNK